MTISKIIKFSWFIYFWIYKICTFTKLKNSQNLLIKKNFKNLENITFGKLLKIGALKREKTKFACSNNLKKWIIYFVNKKNRIIGPLVTFNIGNF